MHSQKVAKIRTSGAALGRLRMLTVAIDGNRLATENHKRRAAPSIGRE
jgi:hypothetical protein